ncbi:MAG: hypothetical protein EOP24_34940 [Hyphomicrobiales bacterium]|nr:MAG: hypothetical protein EOP24_34940 [Hyphomicrobiales bacterium]
MCGQTAQLTGYRCLDGYSSDDAQYTALMNAGVTFAQQYGLRPGVALIAATDIAPTLAVVRAGHGLNNSNNATKNLQLTAEGADLTNISGTIAGREAVQINAQNIDNLFGRITGREVALNARQDINIVGATVEAQRSLTLDAGRDINVSSTLTQGRSSAAIAGNADFGLPGARAASVQLDRIAGLYVSDPGGTLVATAGRDMTLTAAQVNSGGSVRLRAERDLTLDTLTTGETLDARWSADNTRQSEVTQAHGTRISATGNVTLSAGRDLSAHAVDIQAGQTLSMAAGGTLTIAAAETHSNAETSHAHGGSEHMSFSADSEIAGLTRSRLNAHTIELSSGGDTTLLAVDATARQMTIDTGGVLHLDAPVTTSRANTQHSEGDNVAFSNASSRLREDGMNYNHLDVGQLTVNARGGVQAQIGQNDSLSALASQPGMGPATAGVLTLIVGMATAGAGAEVVGTAGNLSTGGGLVMGTTGTASTRQRWRSVFSSSCMKSLALSTAPSAFNLTL